MTDPYAANNQHPPAPIAPQPAPHVQQANMAGGSMLKPKKRVGAIRIMGIALLIGFVLFNISIFVLPMFAMFGGGGSGDPYGVHESYRDGKGKSKIVVIPVSGVIMEGGGGGLFTVPGLDPVSMVRDGLKRAADKDENVKAVVLEINSPGGGVGASDRIHHEIMNFKKENPNIPVVVYMKDLAASGGYYIAAPADYIVASRTTLTGSIGVIIQGFNFHGTLTEIAKGQDATIKAGGNKTMGSMFADPESAEYAEGRKLLQELVDEMHTQFKGLVKDGRKGKLKAGWEELADGRIMSSKTAEQYGFIDKIGYFEAVLDYLATEKGIKDPLVVQYGRQVSLADMLGLESADDLPAAASQFKPMISEAAMAAEIKETLRLYPGKPMAIWQP